MCRNFNLYERVAWLKLDYVQLSALGCLSTGDRHPSISWAVNLLPCPKDSSGFLLFMKQCKQSTMHENSSWTRK